MEHALLHSAASFAGSSGCNPADNPQPQFLGLHGIPSRSRLSVRDDLPENTREIVVGLQGRFQPAGRAAARWRRIVS